LVVGGLPQAPVTNVLTAAAAVQGAAISDAGTLLLATSAATAASRSRQSAQGGTALHPGNPGRLWRHELYRRI
jgi:hypothetical protein